MIRAQQILTPSQEYVYSLPFTNHLVLSVNRNPVNNLSDLDMLLEVTTTEADEQAPQPADGSLFIVSAIVV
jgi:hypothetical protein